MLHRLVGLILGVDDGTGFGSYFQGLQRAARSGIPTREEAQRDYKVLLHSRSRDYLNYLSR